MREPRSGPDHAASKAVFLSLLFAFLTVLPGTDMATTYKWVDDADTVHFTDNVATIPKGVEYKKLGQGTVSTVPAYQPVDIYESKVPYRQRGPNMIVNVSINDVPMAMIIDTGASNVVIPPSLAKRAGIGTRGARVMPVETANGKINAPVVLIRHMKVGDADQEDITATVMVISQDNPEIGLLGMSYLNRFRFQIDQDRKLLVLERR